MKIIIVTKKGRYTCNNTNSNGFWDSFLFIVAHLKSLVVVFSCIFSCIPGLLAQQRFVGKYTDKTLSLQEDFDFTSDRITGTWYVTQISSRKAPLARCLSFNIRHADEDRTANVDILAVSQIISRGKLILSPDAEKTGRLNWNFMGQSWKSQLIATDYSQYLILRSLVSQVANSYQEMVTVFCRSQHPTASTLNSTSEEMEKVGLGYLNMIPVAQTNCGDNLNLQLLHQNQFNQFQSSSSHLYSPSRLTSM